MRLVPVLLALVATAPAAGTTTVVTPASAWCSVVNAAKPGDTIVFSAGSYTGTCSISVSGSASAPITLRSQSAAAVDRAVMAYAGASSNILDVYGSYLVFRWLTFGPTSAGVNPFKLRSSMQGVEIDQNVFQGTDIAVAANSYPGVVYQNISVTNNVLTNMKSTGLYFGCHDGTSCHALGILIQGNLIHTVAAGDGVGYGLEIKLNSWATILENTVYASNGPGIMVYGSNRGDPASVVERNYVQGAAHDAGINVGGGPAIVRNNVAVGNGYNGIWAQDYGGRHLQQNVWIVHNTVLDNQVGGISVQNWQVGAGNVLAFNAIAPLSTTPALSPASPLGTVLGNVTCNPAATCFVQPTTAPYDLWPAAGGPLIGAAGSGIETWRPADDFLCVPRGVAADAGAMQRTASGSGPLLGDGNARPPCGAPLGARLNTLTPCRLIDTRLATGAWGGPALVAGAERDFTLTGRCGIPASARVVTGNITVTSPTSAGSLSIRPGGTVPVVSSPIAYRAGQTRANNVFLLLGGGGDVLVSCSQPSGTTHFVLDVNGYFE